MGALRLGMGLFLFLCFTDLPLTAQQIRYTHETKLGVLWTAANLAKPVALTVQTYHGAQFSHFFSMGATAGYDEYMDFSVVPVGLGTRGILPGKRGSWYAGMAVGHGFMWLEKNTPTEWYDGGVFFNPTVGRRWKAKGKEHDRFLLNIGFKQQVLTRHYASDINWGANPYASDKFTLGRMSVRFGLVF